MDFVPSFNASDFSTDSDRAGQDATAELILPDLSSPSLSPVAALRIEAEDMVLEGYRLESIGFASNRTVASFWGDVKGELVMPFLDIHDKVGKFTAFKQQVRSILMTNGELNIAMDALIDQAKLSGLEVLQTSLLPKAPEPLTEGGSGTAQPLSSYIRGVAAEAGGRADAFVCGRSRRKMARGKIQRERGLPVAEGREQSPL